MFLHAGLLCVFGLSVIACGGDDVTATDGPLAEVSGTRIRTHITENGNVDVPIDPAETTLEALVLQPDGSFSAPIPGTLSADGTFVIPGVPHGTYYLVLTDMQFGRKTMIVTSARTFDLGGRQEGRPDAEQVKTPSTLLTLNIAGLNPFQFNDDIELYALGSRTMSPGIETGSLSQPALGDTSLDMTLDASKIFSAGLIDGTKGDRAYLTQVVSHKASDSYYRALEKVYAPPPFTLVEGGTTTLTGTFENAPQIPLQLTWSRGAFEALGSQVHPSAKRLFDKTHLTCKPEGVRRTFNLPTLFEVTNNVADTVTVSGSYGNPFPSEWPVIVLAWTRFAHEFTVPGDPTVHLQYADVTVDGPLGPKSAVTLAPQMSPPQDVRVHGMSAWQDLSGVGTSPRVEWKAPSLGTPTIYQVDIHEVVPAQEFTKLLVYVLTTDTSFVIPPGLLKPGTYYTLEITAEGNTSITAPFKSVYAPTASTVTNPFTP
jgi:hypothetical protein